MILQADASPPAFVRPAFRDKRPEGYPKIRNSYATFYIAFSTLIMAYSGLIGAAPILVLYTIWFPHIKYKGKLTIGLSKDFIGPILFGGWCVLSAVWSDQRPLTAKMSLEYASMILITVIVARTVTFEALLKGMIIGLFLVLLVPFKGGHYSIDGLFGSKNSVGSYAELGLFSTFVFLFAKRNRMTRLFWCFIPLGLFAACLVFSQSGTSYVSLAAAFAIGIAAYFLGKFPERARMPLLITMVFFIVLFAAAAFYWGLQDAGLNLLGKDSSLTGRTYLWMQGINFTMHGNPLMGLGYDAFWVPGRPLAEQLWYKFDIFDRTGFHFHNMFVNTFVDLGFVGLFIIVYIYVSTCVASFRYLVRTGAHVESIFYIGLTIMFWMRAVAEIDMAGPFGIGPMLFYSILPRITERLNGPKTSPSVAAPVKKGLPWRDPPLPAGGRP